MLYALALLLMIVAVIFLCLSVIFGDLEWVLTGIGALLFFRFIVACQRDAQRPMTAAERMRYY